MFSFARAFHSSQVFFKTLVLGSICVFVVGSVSAGEPSSSSPLIIAGKTLASEGSWAKARDAFVAAREANKDPALKRWCDLWVLDASWRSAPEPNWQEREAYLKTQHEVFDALSKSYVEGAPKDAFWLEVAQSRCAFEGKFDYKAYWERVAEIADYLGAREPSAQAARDYVSFLTKSVFEGDFWRYNNPGIQVLRAHLLNGIRIGTTAADRAWCAWFNARLQQNEEAAPGELEQRLRARDERWKAAIVLSKGTEWEASVRADDFLWRTRLGWAPDAPVDSSADIPEILKESARLRGALTTTQATEINRSLLSDLDRLEKELGEPQVRVEMAKHFVAGSPVRLSYGIAGFGRLGFSLLRMEPLEWLRFISQGRRSNLAPTGRSMKAWSVELADPSKREWRGEIVELGNALAPGFYVLSVVGEQPVSGDEVHTNLAFLVSNIWGSLVTDDSGTNVLFACSAVDGSPVVGGAVSGIVYTPIDKKTVPWCGTTDAAGSVCFHHDNDQWQTSIVGTVGDQPFWCERYGSHGSPKERTLADIVFDRPLYKPGEIAHWKLFVRERKDGRFVIPDGSSRYKMSASLGDVDLVTGEGLTPNAFGTAHGEIAIPAEARPGPASITLSVSNKERGQESVKLSGAFQVDRFVPPAVVAKMELASGAQSLRPGQEIVVRVQADYFSGGPVVNVPADCRIRIDPGNFPTSAEIVTQYRAWKSQWLDRPLTAVTSANGAAEFHLTVPRFVTDGTSVHFDVAVRPTGAPAVTTQASYRILETGLSMDPEHGRQLRVGNAGDTMVFQTRLLDGAAQPVSRKVMAQVVELRWAETWAGPDGKVLSAEEMKILRAKTNGSATTSGASVEPEGWIRTFAGYLEHIVSSLSVKTGSDGVLEMPFKLPEAGLFQFRVVDTQGRRLPIASEIGAYDDFFTRSSLFPYDFDPSHGLHSDAFTVFVEAPASTAFLAPTASILFASDMLQPDRPLKVTVAVPENVSHAWLAVCGEDKVSSLMLPLNGRLSSLELPTSTHFSGRGTLQLSYFTSDGQSRQLTQSFSALGAAKQLRVTLEPTAASQRPGSDAMVNVKVADAAGKPVRAELALAVSDDAVVQLASNGAKTEPNHLLSWNRTLTAQITSFGEAQAFHLQLLPDNRAGARLNRSFDVSDEDMVELSPFSVESNGDVGYTASTTLAGTRVRTTLTEVGAAISVVNKEFLKDVGATSPEVLSQYTLSTEVGGTYGNFNGPSIALRRHFASTAFWLPELVTDEKGNGTAAFKYPDNLSQWRFDAYAVSGDGNAAGHATAFTRTSLPLQARLLLPLYLISGDAAQATGVFVNRTDEELKAKVRLAVSGKSVQLSNTEEAAKASIVPKQGEAHAAWKVRADEHGTAEFTLASGSDAGGDAMRTTLPVLEDGIQQKDSATLKLGVKAKREELVFDLPAKLDASRTEVRLQLTPSRAAAVLDALPYLVDYPYGCVEQTMSRFLPAVIVRKALTDLGLDAEAVENRILALESERDAARRGETAGLRNLDRVVADGLSRLKEAQRRDGSFGWWADAPDADLWMTAYVGWGLALAKSAGVEVPEQLEESTNRAIMSAFEQDTLGADDAAWALAALAKTKGESDDDENVRSERFSQLYAERATLSASGRACLALAAIHYGTVEQKAVLVRNLEDGVRQDSKNALVQWGGDAGGYRSREDAVEVTSLALLALLELDPSNALVDPAMTWLVLNRTSSHWSSTRSTAFAVLALSKYLSQHNELGGTVEADVYVNAQALGTVTLDRASLLKGTPSLPLPVKYLKGGRNRLELKRRSGEGPLYGVVSSSVWVAGAHVRPAGQVIKVARSFERQTATPTLTGALRITPESLADGGHVREGEHVTVAVRLTVATDLEYLMIEVPKPAGCTPLNPLSGWDASLRSVLSTTDPKRKDTGGRAVYREERDDRSVFFLDKLEAGTWELRFELRAITPGDFRAFPVEATAVYVPQLSGNSDARRVLIQPE